MITDSDTTVLIFQWLFTSVI